MPYDIVGSQGPSFDILGSGQVGAEPKDIQGTPTILGFFRNLVGDVGELAQGITGLVGAVGHDVVAGFEHLIPGRQQAEEEGFRTLQIAKALPAAVTGDYARRYGGVTNIARGLYEDPLSYILDVFTVGAGVSAAAKIGRAGILSKLPPIVPEGAATKILGAGKELKYIPRSEYVNLTTRPGVASPIRLSQNPVTRQVQERALQALSVEPASSNVAKVIGGADELSAAYMRESQAYAQAAGLRVFRPGRVSDFARRRSINFVLGQMRVNTRDLTIEARETVADIFKTADNPERSGHFLRGNVGVGHSLRTDAIDLGVDSLPGDPPPVSPFTRAEDLDVLMDRFGNDNVVLTNLNTPHSTATPAGEIPYRVAVLVDEPGGIVSAGDEALRLVGARKIHTKNYFGDEETAYDGYHVFGRKTDGTSVDVSVTTRDGYFAQKSYSKLAARMDTNQKKMLDLEAQIMNATPDTTPNETVRLVDEYATAQEEVYALDQLAKVQFRPDRLRYWHGDDLDADLVAAERARAYLYREVTERWMDSSPSASAATYWNRAYAEQRVWQFYDGLPRLRQEFERILTESSDTKTAMPHLTDLLVRDGIPAQLVQKILGARPWKKNPAAGADALVRKYRANLYDHMVEEGGRGLEFGFPQFDWRVMHQQRLDLAQPIPSYFPHYSRKPSEALGLVKPKTLVARPPGTSKSWTGKLLEEGRVIDDPVEVFSRATTEWIAHSELKSVLDDVVSLTGMELTKKQVLAFQANQFAGMVLVAPDQLKRMLSLRAETFLDTASGVAEGRAFTAATARAIEDLTEKAFSEALDSLNSSKIYAVPRAVMQQFQEEARWRIGADGLRTYFDGPMALWRASVLSLSPRWVINNVFGNGVFMGLENPGALRYAVGQLDKRTAAVTRQILGEFEIKESRGFFRENASYASVIPEEGAGVFLQGAKWLKESRGGRALSIVSEWTRKKNTYLEQASRRGVFLNSLQRRAMDDWVQGAHSSYEILNRALREGDITAAQMSNILPAVDRTLGNYTRFTPFEQHVLKRFFVPFWSFYRHAVNVTARLPFEHPLKAQVLRQIEAIDEQMRGDFPDWLAGTVNLAELGGEQLYLRLRNLNPLSAIGEEVPLVSYLNPVLKSFIEKEVGVDTYTGEPFRAPENVYQAWNGDYYRGLEDGEGNIVGTEMLERPPTPGLLNMIGSQFPQLSLFPSFQRYPKSVLLQAASMLGVPLSQTDVAGVVESMKEGSEQALTALQNRQTGTEAFDILGG